MADPTVIIDAEPDWGEPPEVAYAFDTVVQGSPQFREQRRPLLVTPVRSIQCRFSLETFNAQRLCNRLLKGMPELVCAPIYSEPFFANSISGSSITAVTDLTYYWNIKHCSYLILLDYVTGAAEMLKVSNVTGQVIALVAAIIGTWVAAQTVIYPAIAASVVGVRSTSPASRVIGVDAGFMEISQGETAVKEWVGLTVQLCPEDIV